MAKIIVESESYSDAKCAFYVEVDEKEGCADVTVGYLNAHIKKNEHPDIYKALVELENAIDKS